MKKIIAVLLAALTITLFAGCANNNQSGADESWNKVKSAGKLVMGLDNAFPPMGYVDTKTGELVGFDIDVAKEVCKRLNVELKLQPIDWSNQTAEINNGNIDCLWNGFSKTEERDQKFNLSIPYMKNNQIILVKSDSSFKSLADLAGKTLGVQSQSSAEAALEKNAEFKKTLKEIVKIDDYSKAVLEIQNGTIDAIAIDEIVARFYLANNPNAYRILEKGEGKVESLAVEDYVVGFRKADNALKAKIEEGLKAIAKDGTLAKISEKWFQEDVTCIEK